MAIEKDLKRIADSLEIIAAAMKTFQPGAFSTPDQPTGNGVTDDTAAPTPPAQTTAPAAPTPPAQTTAPAAPTLTAMTPEQLNAVLVAEFKRLGDRAPIDAAMKELGITSVAGLTDPVQQQSLVAKVKAIPGKAA